MKRELLNYQFSIFGKYDSLYFNISKETEIEKFSEFKKSLTSDVFPDGRAMNCYILTGKDVRIAIHYNRIDFIFAQMNSDDIKKFEKYYSLFSNLIDDVNRLAINYNFFFKDNDYTLMNKFSSLVNNIFSEFGTPSEFSYMTNQVFKSDDIDFNDVVTIQNGSVQKNDSFEPIQALIFLCDINTAVGKANTKHIDLSKIIDLFEIMFNRLLEKTKIADNIANK